MTLFTIDDLKPATPLVYYTENDIRDVLGEYNKTVQDLFDDVKIIKEWLNTQPHLPAQPSDRQIASFMINNKFSIEKTKTKIDMSYTIRALIPEYFENAFPKSKQFQEIFKCLNLVILPKLSKNSSRVLVIRYNKEGQDEIDVDMLTSVFIMFIELLTLIDFSKSFEYVADLSTISFGLCSRFTPSVCLKFIKVIQSVYSGRLKAIHIINLPKILSKIIDLISGVFTSKLQSKFYFHENLDSLKNHYNEEILPEDFGGKEKSIAELKVENLKLFESYNGHFYELTKMKVKEELRPGKLHNDEVLGYYGNFKKINID